MRDVFVEDNAAGMSVSIASSDKSLGYKVSGVIPRNFTPVFMFISFHNLDINIRLRDL